MIKSIRVEGKKIQYQAEGEGPLVMLVHGFAEDGMVWKYQLHALAERHRVIIPDLPGSGGSEQLDDLSMEAMASCLHRIVREERSLNENDNRVVMIGHSMGGYIALAYAAQWPDELSGLGLFHSSAFADTEQKRSMRRRGIEFIQKHGSYEFICQSTPNLFTDEYRIKNSGELAEMMLRYRSFEPKALIAYYQGMIERPDRTAILTSFSKPILFIIGRQDKAIPYEDSMKQCHLPDIAAVEILHHSAHMGMWEEKQKSTDALLGFLGNAVFLNASRG